MVSQGYPDLEHIIVDGNSSDATLPIIFRHADRIDKLISEPDHGIYDAMNKGISLATGDVIGILNSDDFYAHSHVLEKVARVFKDEDVDTCYGDLIYVDPTNVKRVTRYWRSGAHNPRNFYQGWMPPHPTFFVRKSIYNKYGLLNLKFPLAADYELMLRLLYKYNISATYIPRVIVKMRTGGTSNPGFYTVKANIENYNAWRVNNLKPPLIAFILKPLSKILQYRFAR